MSPNGKKIPYLGVVDFKSSTLDLFTKIFNHIQLCVSFVDLVIYHDFRDLNIYHPLFGLESQNILLSENDEKVIPKLFLFLHIFHDVIFFWRKPEGHKKISICLTCSFNI